MYSIHFILPAELANMAARLPDHRLGKDYPYWLGGRVNWPAHSYLVLRRHRENVSVGTTPRQGVINFAHTEVWRALRVRQGEFRVSFRADYRRLFDVDFEILQNPAVPLGPRQAYLPYWPVPGIKPRDPARRGLRTLAYAGRLGSRNLTAELRDGSRLPIDINVQVIPPERWHVMTETDLLVAIRSFDRDPHHSKPPSKLFAAWLAGIPLIAGYDSAFSAIGRPGVDYLRVSSVSEFVEAVQRLARDPDAYDALVAAGRARAPEISHDEIAKTWLDCIDGPISDAFARYGPRRRSSTRARINRGLDQVRNAVSAIRATLPAR